LFGSSVKIGVFFALTQRGLRVTKDTRYCGVYEEVLVARHNADWDSIAFAVDGREVVTEDLPLDGIGHAFGEEGGFSTRCAQMVRSCHLRPPLRPLFGRGVLPPDEPRATPKGNQPDDEDGAQRAQELVALAALARSFSDHAPSLDLDGGARGRWRGRGLHFGMPRPKSMISPTASLSDTWVTRMRPTSSPRRTTIISMPGCNPPRMPRVSSTSLPARVVKIVASGDGVVVDDAHGFECGVADGFLHERVVVAL
jgi:hypothetical protein